MPKADSQNPVLQFIKEVAMYFMDFLETDFHKRRLPKRSIQFHSKDNLLVGLSLNKYSSFNRMIWEMISKNFEKNKFGSLQKGVYRADIPKNLLDVITLQTTKISESANIGGNRQGCRRGSGCCYPLPKGLRTGIDLCGRQGIRHFETASRCSFRPEA